MNAKWITPAVTAMDEQGHIDIEANKKIYDFLIEKGMDGILLLGSIGEFFAIPVEEKKQLIREALAHINGRVTVYVGTADMNLDVCVELSNYALDQGADGAMVISPFYFNLPDSAILNFYNTLAQRVHGPLLLYNFPDRTGYDLRPDLVYQLVSQNKNIVGIKDTVGTMGHTRGLIQKVKKNSPTSWCTPGLTNSLAITSSAEVTVASRACPILPRKWLLATPSGPGRTTFPAWPSTSRTIDSLMAIYDVAPQFVPVIKKAMALRGVAIGSSCAAPMLPATQEETEKIQAILSKEGLLDQ